MHFVSVGGAWGGVGSCGCQHEGGLGFVKDHCRVALRGVAASQIRPCGLEGGREPS